MLDFLKRFGLGILYVLVSPFLIAFLLLWAIYGIVIFIIEISKCFMSFFKGKKFFTEFPEDVEAKRILSLEPYANNDANTNPQPVVNNDSNNNGDANV